MAGIDATGSVLSRSDMASNPTFTDLANISEGPTGPGLSRASIDVSAHDSPDNSKEFVPGMVDPGEVSMTINWDSAEATHQDVRDDIYVDSVRTYRIEEPDGSTVTFDGFVTGFENARPVDDKLTADITMKVTGKPVWVDAS